MASKTPFLCTDVGNASEIIEWSGGGKLLPTIKNKDGNSAAIIDESIKILEELYLNEEEGRNMAEKAFKIWRKKYTWERISEDYENLYCDLLS